MILIHLIVYVYHIIIRFLIHNCILLNLANMYMYLKKMVTATRYYAVIAKNIIFDLS